MAKVKPSIIGSCGSRAQKELACFAEMEQRSRRQESGSIGDRVFYTRFGKTFSRRRPTQINDRQSEAQLRQRALFNVSQSESRGNSFTLPSQRNVIVDKAMQHTASLLGSAIQRGLAREAHSNGHVENNEFASLWYACEHRKILKNEVSNKQCFVYEGGIVHIDYLRLLLSTGPVGRVDFTQCRVDELHVELSFAPCMGASHTRPDDVVHIYAVEFQAEICQLVASASRKDGCVAFDLPDLNDDPDYEPSPTFYLYAIVGSCESRAQSQACLRYAEMK